MKRFAGVVFKGFRYPVDRVNADLAVHPSGEAGAVVEALVPFVKEQRPMNGKATAYVC